MDCYIQMRKEVKEIKEVKEMKEGNSLHELQRRYQQETTILRKEKSDYEAKLHREIEGNAMKEMSFEREKQSLNRRISSLSLEVEGLRAQLNQVEDSSEEDIVGLQYQKQLLLQNGRLKADIEENCEIIEALEEQKNELNAKNNQLQREMQQMRREFISVEQSMLQVNELRQSLTRECKLFAEEAAACRERQHTLQRQLEQVRGRLNESKRKKREWERKFNELQEKALEWQNGERVQLQGQIHNLKQGNERSEHKCMQLLTKLQFAGVAISQKDELLRNTEEQLRKRTNQFESERTELQQMKAKLSGSNEKYEELLRSNQQQMRDVEKRHKEEVAQARKSVLEQVSALLQNRDVGAVEQYVLEMRSCRSQGNLQMESFREDLLQKIKADHQVQQLQTKILVMEKTDQQYRTQLTALKNQLEDKKKEIQGKVRENGELRERMERADRERQRELTALSNQLRQLRGKETQYLQTVRDKEQFEEAASLKMMFLDKKIKELMESVGRKDGMIEKLKQNKWESEQKIKASEEQMGRVLEQCEGLRRVRQDSTRKEELLKDYKAKIEKLKQEVESLKIEGETARKERAKIEKQLEGKDAQISAWKQKSEKLESETVRQESGDTAHKLKEIKAAYELKLKRAKKEGEEAHEILREMREAMLSKVQECVARSILMGKKKPQEYEAAKMLGLKAGELQEFVNPISGVNRTICTQLQILWEGGHFVEFTRGFIDYVCASQ